MTIAAAAFSFPAHRGPPAAVTPSQAMSRAHQTACHAGRRSGSFRAPSGAAAVSHPQPPPRDLGPKVPLPPWDLAPEPPPLWDLVPVALPLTTTSTRPTPFDPSDEHAPSPPTPSPRPQSLSRRRRAPPRHPGELLLPSALPRRWPWRGLLAEVG
uniref:Uncharacterized protein n=1 Tax=Arundo donax TaxID=35708 RepID=A0A0A9BLA6_ARUDO